MNSANVSCTGTSCCSKMNSISGSGGERVSSVVYNMCVVCKLNSRKELGKVNWEVDKK